MYSSLAGLDFNTAELRCLHYVHSLFFSHAHLVHSSSWIYVCTSNKSEGRCASSWNSSLDLCVFCTNCRILNMWNLPGNNRYGAGQYAFGWYAAITLLYLHISYHIDRSLQSLLFVKKQIRTSPDLHPTRNIHWLRTGIWYFCIW